MRAMLILRYLRGENSQDSVHKPQILKREDHKSTTNFCHNNAGHVAWPSSDILLLHVAGTASDILLLHVGWTFSNILLLHVAGTSSDILLLHVAWTSSDILPLHVA